MKRLPPLILVAVLGVTLAGCRRQPTEAGQTVAVAGRHYRVGYTCFTLTAPWTAAYKQAFDKELGEHPEYEVTWFDGKADTSLVAPAIGSWVDRKLDLIVSSSPDHVPLRAIYKKALDAGIPVLLTGDAPDYHVYGYMTAFSGFSAWDGGRMAAELLNATLGGTGTVALITAPRGSASELQNTEGFTSALRRLSSRIAIATVEDGRSETTASYQKTLSVLTRFPGIDAIYAPDDAMATAVIRALKARGYTAGQVKVVAQGGSKAAIEDLRDGWYIGIIYQDPALCARQDVWLIQALLEQGRALPRVAEVRQEVITKQNAARFPGW